MGPIEDEEAPGPAEVTVGPVGPISVFGTFRVDGKMVDPISEVKYETCLKILEKNKEEELDGWEKAHNYWWAIAECCDPTCKRLNFCKSCVNLLLEYFE